MPHDGGVGLAVRDLLPGAEVGGVVCCGGGCLVGVFGEGGAPGEVAEGGDPFRAPVVGPG